ncbi:MAG: hypothetical protein ACE5JO_04925 [Candidatus Binatia bacterium]
MPNKTGYMDKERVESAMQHKEYLQWLKAAQAESAMQHRAFFASNREYAKTLGKFDNYREKIRKIKY